MEKTIKNKYFRLFTAAVLAAGIAYISACTNRNREEAYPKVPAGTPCPLDSAVSYIRDVEPLISQKCYVCHSNNNNGSDGGGNDLQGYDDFANLAADSTSGVIYDITRPTSDEHYMPQAMSPLDSCEIKLIKAWVRQGFLDN